MDSVRLDRVGRMIRDYGLEAVRYAIAVTVRKERRRWTAEQSLRFMERCAATYTPESAIQPSPRVGEALADSEAKRVAARKRAEAALAARGLIETGNALEAEAEAVF